MSDREQQVEQYLDGLLGEQETRAFEAALKADTDLAAELERARRFEHLLDRVREREGALRRVLAAVGGGRRPGLRRLGPVTAAAVAAAALLVAFWLGTGSREPSHEQETVLAWVDFGRRLGRIAAERRTGRVPRLGLGELAVPPPDGYGTVFSAALEALRVSVEPGAKKRVKDLVRDHFLALDRLGDDLQAECARAEASLKLYRRLRSLAGSAVADAYFDVFRPALATPRSVHRVRPGTIGFVLDRDTRARYERKYEHALHQLDRRYGGNRLGLALQRLAGADRRFLGRDSSQDGLGRDAVLAIRARLYRAACEAGVDKLYIVQAS